MMHKVNVIAAGLAVAALAGSVFGYASDPTIVTWQDNFDGQTLGVAPYQMTGWTGDGPKGWSVVDDGGNRVVSDGGATGASNGYAYAWTSHVADGHLSLDLEPYELQILHFTARQAATGTPTGNRQVQIAFQFMDLDGNPIGGWRLTGTGYLPIAWNAEHSSNGSGLVPYLGPETQFPDSTNYHDFDMHWYKTTGQMEWYVDGVLYDSFDYSSRVSGGPVDASVIQWDNNAIHADTIYYDDVKAGTIPEPGTLVLLGLGGLLVSRRRRA